MITEALIIENEDGEQCLQLTDKLLKELDWREGDTLVWTDNKNGTFSLTKRYVKYFNHLDHERIK